MSPRYDCDLPESANKLIRATRLLCWDFQISEEPDAPVELCRIDERDQFQLGLEQCRMVLDYEVSAMEETSGATKFDVQMRLARLLVISEYMHITSYKSLIVSQLLYTR